MTIMIRPTIKEQLETYLADKPLSEYVKQYDRLSEIDFYEDDPLQYLLEQVIEAADWLEEFIRKEGPANDR